MSADKKNNAKNLMVVTAKLLKTTKQLEARVKALEAEVAQLKLAAGQPASEPIDHDAPPPPAIAMPPGVRRTAA